MLKHSLHNELRQFGSTKPLGKATKHTQLPSAQRDLVKLQLELSTFRSSICLAAALSLRSFFTESSKIVNLSSRRILKMCSEWE